MFKSEGNRNMDIETLIRVRDEDLINICLADNYVNSLCRDQNFWWRKIIYTFPYVPIDILDKGRSENGYNPNRNWSEYYINDLLPKVRRMKRDNRSANQFMLDGCFEGRIDIILISIHFGGDINVCLGVGVKSNRVEVFKYLAENNIYHIPERSYDWVLQYAQNMEYDDMIEFLNTQKGIYKN